MDKSKGIFHKAAISILFFIVATTILYTTDKMDNIVENTKAKSYDHIIEPTDKSTIKGVSLGTLNNINSSNKKVNVTVKNKQKPFEEELKGTDNNIFRGTILFGRMAVKGINQWITESVL